MTTSPPYRAPARRPYAPPAFFESVGWPGGVEHVEKHWTGWLAMHTEAKQRLTELRAKRVDGVTAAVLTGLVVAGIVRTLWEWLS